MKGEQDRGPGAKIEAGQQHVVMQRPVFTVTHAPFGEAALQC
jgi:hypothetical protein